jgi:hypothetical protein
MVLPPPKVLNRDVREFCSEISHHEPLFAPVKPAANAKQSYCFDNVTAVVRSAGGSIVYGWAIWTCQGVYLEAEHHGIWRSRQGELIDVSPSLSCSEHVLFLPDPVAVYDPNSFRPNIIKAVGTDAEALEIVEVLQALASLLDPYRGPGIESAYLSPRDQRQRFGLQLRYGNLSNSLVKKYPPL